MALVKIKRHNQLAKGIVIGFIVFVLIGNINGLLIVLLSVAGIAIAFLTGCIVSTILIVKAAKFLGVIKK